MRSEEELEDQTPAGDESDGGTSPEEPTHEATMPPGNGPVDEDTVAEGEEKLDQAGGGH